MAKARHKQQNKGAKTVANRPGPPCEVGKCSGSNHYKNNNSTPVSNVSCVTTPPEIVQCSSTSIIVPVLPQRHGGDHSIAATSTFHRNLSATSSTHQYDNKKHSSPAVTLKFPPPQPSFPPATVTTTNIQPEQISSSLLETGTTTHIGTTATTITPAPNKRKSTNFINTSEFKKWRCIQGGLTTFQADKSLVQQFVRTALFKNLKFIVDDCELDYTGKMLLATIEAD